MLSQKRTWVQVSSADEQYSGHYRQRLFYSDNEGHIFAKLTNDGREGKNVELAKGNGFMQGIFCRIRDYRR